MQILLRTLEDTIYTLTYASIHLFVYVVIHLVSKHLFGNYYLQGSGTESWVNQT